MPFTLPNLPYAHDALEPYIDKQIELIQPLEGRSIYSDFLQAHGPGLHHIRFSVEPFDAAVVALTAPRTFSPKTRATRSDAEYPFRSTRVSTKVARRTRRPPTTSYAGYCAGSRPSAA